MEEAIRVTKGKR